MRKEEGTNEKRTLDVMDDFSEELERVIQNPDLLPEETYDEWKSEDSHMVHNSRHYSTHSHHHSSGHHHSSHSHSHSDTYGSSSGSSHHRAHRRTGTGRLASHHRPRRHHHHSGGTNASHTSSVSTSEIANPTESTSATQMSEELIEIYPVPDDINSGKYDDVTTNIEYFDEKDTQGQYAYAEDTEPVVSGKNVSTTVAHTPSVNRTKRIASMASGSESSKRKAERADDDSSGRKSRRRKKHHRRKKIGFVGVLLRILIVFLVLGIVLVGSLVYLRAHGENSMKKPVEEVQIVIPRDDSEVPEIEEVEDDGKTITYRGEKYRYNDNVSTILFMGTDRTTAEQESTETVIGINGQADTIILCVIDNANQKISFINVNRDTMVPVSEYTPDGDYAGDKVMQICLAYSYGADNVQSSERMVEAVSKYLYGMPINAYCRLSYDGIPTLNDAVGGVTVTVPEDMTAVNPEWVEGTTITLQGEETAAYVRYRNTNTVHTNELRMSRQKQYLKAFMNQTMDQVRADLSLPLTLYSIAAGYMTTDITTSQVTYLSSKVLEYGISDDAIFSIPGESVDGEEHVEFYTDDKGLYEIILNTFYNKV